MQNDATRICINTTDTIRKWDSIITGLAEATSCIQKRYALDLRSASSVCLTATLCDNIRVNGVAIVFFL